MGLIIGTYGSGSSTVSTGWQRDPNWLPMPTIDPLINIFAGLFLVYEGAVNATTIQATNNSLDVDWGDLTSTTTDGTTQLKVYNYASLSGTIYVDEYGRNYKQVMITLTETGAVTPTQLLIDQALGVASLNSTNNYVDIACSVPNVTDFRVSGIRPLTLLERFICYDNSLMLYPSSTFLDAIKLRVLQIDLSVFLTGTSFFSNSGNITEFNGVKAPFDMSFTNAINLTSTIRNTRIKELGDINILSNCILSYAIGLNYDLTKIGDVDVSASTNTSFLFTGNYAIIKINSVDISSSTTISHVCAYSPTLTEVHFIGCSNVTVTTNAFIGCNGLEKLTLNGLTVGISLANCSMGAEAINDLFTSLGTASGSQTITVTGNPGAGTCNTTIATAKGWTVAT